MPPASRTARRGPGTERYGAVVHLPRGRDETASTHLSFLYLIKLTQLYIVLLASFWGV